MAVRLWVNGREVEVEAGPGEMLSDALRYQLGLTGTKIGCNEDECGACTVLMDGVSVLSCNIPLPRAAGKQIVTIEGLAKNGVLHPLQQAFIKHGAVQCGFCIPGQIMTAAAFLQSNPSPSRQQIQKAMKSALCRCGGYPSIERAILAAAASLRTGAPVQDPEPIASPHGLVIGKLLARPDAVEKVTGASRFADDIVLPAMLHGRTLRAAVPHGVLRRLEVERARALPGVAAVLTASEIPGEHYHGLITRDWPSLVGVGEKVRYVGDAVALVAAETKEIAAEALRLIEAEYERLPVVDGPLKAYAEGATRVHREGNILAHIEVLKGDLEQGFAQADVVVEDTYHTPSSEHAFIEPECSLAQMVDGGVEIYVGSQIPFSDREQVAAALGLTVDQVRIIGTVVGGAFGGKEDIAGQIHAALLAQATGRPVKVLYHRYESFQVHPKRHATQIRLKLGARRDGTIVAAETEIYGDTGAYASLGAKVMGRATTHSAGPYAIANVKADCYAMYTNNPPAGAFRGFGVTQAAFAVESLIDDLAAELGIDPIALRLKNALEVGATTITGQVLQESVGLGECIQKVDAEMRRLSGELDPFAPQVIDGGRKVRAWGFAAGFKNTGLGGGAPDTAGAEAELFEDGTLEVRTASAELGQGLPTVLQMIAAEVMSMPAEKVRVFLSDTRHTLDGGATTASRQTFIAGNAVRHATEVLRNSIASVLGERFDIDPAEVLFIDGNANIRKHCVSLGQVVGLMRAENREPRASYLYTPPATQPLGSGGDLHFAFSYAAQAAEVEIDLETGEVMVLRVISANDVGKAINPLGLLAQVEGGVTMGLGGALTEDFIVEQGELFTDGMARYRIPSIMQMPEVISLVVEHPTSSGPFGAKGVGEVTSVPTAPAITNAIYHAIGIRCKSLPVDQDWLLRTLKDKDRVRVSERG